MTSSLRLVELGLADMKEIIDLEQKVCTPLIQATAETISTRLDRGNIMLGVRSGTNLVGAVGFRYDTFGPDVPVCTFARDFGEFSTSEGKPVSGIHNAGYAYSLNVDPNCRALAVRKPGSGPPGVGMMLMRGMQDRMRADDCKYLVGDGRPTFYNGSTQYEHEHYKQVPKLRAILDRYTSAEVPTDDEKAALMKYPIFRAYDRLLGGGTHVYCIIPDFFPGDTPTGGYRVILYKDLTS